MDGNLGEPPESVLETLREIGRRIRFFIDPNRRYRNRVLFYIRRVKHRIKNAVLWLLRWLLSLRQLPNQHPYSLFVPWVCLGLGVPAFTLGTIYLVLFWQLSVPIFRYWVCSTWLTSAKLFWGLVFIKVYGKRIHSFARTYYKPTFKELRNHYEFYFLLASATMTVEMETDGGLLRWALLIPGYLIYWHVPIAWLPFDGTLRILRPFESLFSAFGWQWIALWLGVYVARWIYTRIRPKWAFVIIWTVLWTMIETWRRGKGLPWPEMHTSEVLGPYGQYYSLSAMGYRGYLLWSKWSSKFLAGSFGLYWYCDINKNGPKVHRRFRRWLRSPFIRSNGGGDDGGGGFFNRLVRRFVDGPWTWRGPDGSDEDYSASSSDDIDSDPDEYKLEAGQEAELARRGVNREERRMLLSGRLGVAGLQELLKIPRSEALGWWLVTDQVITEADWKLLGGNVIADIDDVMMRLPNREAREMVFEFLETAYLEQTPEQREALDERVREEERKQVEEEKARRERARAEAEAAAKENVGGLKKKLKKKKQVMQIAEPIIWATGEGYKPPGQDSDTEVDTEVDTDNEQSPNSKGNYKGKKGPTTGILKPPAPEGPLSPPETLFPGAGNFHERFTFDPTEIGTPFSSEGLGEQNIGSGQPGSSSVWGAGWANTQKDKPSNPMATSFYDGDDEDDGRGGLPGGAPGDHGGSKWLQRFQPSRYENRAAPSTSVELQERAARRFKEAYGNNIPIGDPPDPMRRLRIPQHASEQWYQRIFENRTRLVKPAPYPEATDPYIGIPLIRPLLPLPVEPKVATRRRRPPRRPETILFNASSSETDDREGERRLSGRVSPGLWAAILSRERRMEEALDAENASDTDSDDFEVPGLVSDGELGDALESQDNDADTVAEAGISKTAMTQRKVRKLEEMERLMAGELILVWPPSDTEGRQDNEGNWTPPITSSSSDETDAPLDLTSSSESGDDSDKDPEWLSSNKKTTMAPNRKKRRSKNKGKDTTKKRRGRAKDAKQASPLPPASGGEEVTRPFASARMLSPLLYEESLTPTWVPPSSPGNSTDSGWAGFAPSKARLEPKLQKPFVEPTFGRGERYMTPEDIEEESWTPPPQPQIRTIQRDNPWRLWYLVGCALFLVWYVVGDMHRVREDYMYGSGLSPWEDLSDAPLKLTDEDMERLRQWESARLNTSFRVLEADDM